MRRTPWHVPFFHQSGWRRARVTLCRTDEGRAFLNYEGSRLRRVPWKLRMQCVFSETLLRFLSFWMPFPPPFQVIVLHCVFVLVKVQNPQRKIQAGGHTGQSLESIDCSWVRIRASSVASSTIQKFMAIWAEKIRNFKLGNETFSYSLLLFLTASENARFGGSWIGKKQQICYIFNITFLE